MAVGICAAVMTFMPMGVSAVEGQTAAGTTAEGNAELRAESEITGSEAVPENEAGESESTEDFVYTEEYSRRPSPTEASYITDGSQDLVYRFENGTGEFRVEKITEVWLTCRFINQCEAAGVGDSKFLPGEFDYDIENGTVTLYGDALKRLGDLEDGYHIDRACVTFTGLNAERSEILHYSDIIRIRKICSR